MTEARQAARAAAKEVIEQTEIDVRDLRKSLRMRALDAAFLYASETPYQYRDGKLYKKCLKIAHEVVDELLGGARMSDELSDLAFQNWWWSERNGLKTGPEGAWKECSRRAEALLEQERAVRIRVEKMYQTLTESIETERRGSFQAGWIARGIASYGDAQIGPDDEDEAYRAYTEAAKELRE